MPVTKTFGRMRIALLAVVLVATGAGSFDAAGARPAQAAPSLDCHLIALSPQFESDRTMFCVGRVPDLATRTISTYFWVSRDAGAMWTRAAAAGLVTSQTSVPEQLVASPLYETDQTLFLHTDEGIWKTPDLGETFTLVDGVANPGEGRLAPFVETLGGQRVVLAYANREFTAKLDPPLHVPIVGAPEPEVRFVLPENFPEGGDALVVTQRSGEDPAVILFACDAPLTCTERLFEFPTRHEFGNLWLGPPSVDGRTVFVETLTRSEGDDWAEPTLWRSDDGGRTFTEWSSINRLLDPIATAQGREARVGIALDPADASRLVMRISYLPKVRGRATRQTPPGEQLFLSVDAGVTWKRVSRALSWKQTGRPGTIPWNNVAHQTEAYVTFAGDYLIALGDVLAPLPEGSQRPYCSVDLGRSWSTACPAAS